jgi:hypothetical protein
MRAFKVFPNGKRVCAAGIGTDGVLTTTLRMFHFVAEGKRGSTLEAWSHRLKSTFGGGKRCFGTVQKSESRSLSGRASTSHQNVSPETACPKQKLRDGNCECSPRSLDGS